MVPSGEVRISESESWTHLTNQLTAAKLFFIGTFVAFVSREISFAHATVQLIQ